MSGSRKRSRGANYSGLTRDSARVTFKSNVDVQQNRKIKTLQTQVAKLTKGDEVKYLDRSFTNSVTSTGTILPLNNPALFAGAQQSRHEQREGQSLVTTQFLCKGLVYIDQNSVSADSNNRIRILVVLTKDSTTPQNISDVLQATLIDSFNKIKPPHDYQVLWDKTFNVQNPGQYYAGQSGSAAISTATERYRIPFSIKLGSKAFGSTGCKATWVTSDGGDTAPRTGALTMLMFSDSGVVSHPIVKARTRYRFIDN